MTDRVEVSRAFFEQLGRYGVAIDEVGRRSGLSLDGDEEIVLTTTQMFALWAAIGQVSADPSLGLRMGRDMRSERFDPLLLVALSAPNFRGALEALARYKRLCGAEEVRVIDGALVRVEIDWIFGRDGDPGLLLDSAIASFVEVGCRGTGRTVRPECVELRRDDDALGTYERHFGCRVRYGQSHDAVVFSARQAELPFLPREEGDPRVQPRLEVQLAERERGRWSDRVRFLLRRELGGRRPGLEDVAQRLNQSARTLQRRLASEGAAFQRVLDEVRRDLARQYLEESAMSLAQISYLVGFDEPHSFLRAFKRHEGVSPGQWRTERKASRPSEGEKLSRARRRVSSTSPGPART